MLSHLLLLVTVSQTPTIADRGQVIIRQLAAGEFAAIDAQLTDQMKAAMPGGIEVAWKTLIAQAGAFQKASGAREQQVGGYQLAIVSAIFERAELDLRIAFDANGRIAGFGANPRTLPSAPYTLPSYARPDAFDEREISIGSGEWVLPGTLAMPRGEGPFAAVVLVAGSGPADRDTTFGPNKPFRDLAVGLASRGIAVLRYDKRSKVHGSRMAGRAITVKDEVLDDVAVAISVLRATPRIHPQRIFVLGHSLGGMLIPRIGAADPLLAGLIVTAGAARPLEEAMVAQLTYLANGDGTISPEEQVAIDAARKTADAIRGLTAADASSPRRISGAPASYWLDLRGYDPPTAAKALKQPLLVLQGERDYQVTMEEFERWKTALVDRRNVTFKSYPSLNHLFLPGSGKSLPPEYLVASHVPEQVIDDISTWIRGLEWR